MTAAGARARGRRAALAAVSLLVCASASAHAPMDAKSALAVSQAAIGRQIGDYALTDTAGHAVRLSEYRGRPLLVSLVYTSCRKSCSVVTRQLARSVAVARDALGADRFAVVTVGFDARNDRPARMRAYARAQGVDDPAWRFLSGDAATIDALTADLGFVWFESPQGYDHLTQVSILDAEGRVYRQVYGELVDPPALVEPLKELVWGRPRTGGVRAWVDSLRLFCTLWDPTAGRYRFDYSILVGAVIGVACLGSIAAFVVHAWRESVRAGRRPRSGAA